MGCNSSKATEVVPVSVSVAAPDTQQQADGSHKPWKKNQVAPAPQQPHPEHAAGPLRLPSQKPPAAVIAFVDNGKDAQPYVDQGLADVLEALKALCKEKVPGVELASFFERLHEMNKLHLGVALRAHSQPKDAPQLSSVAERLVACCNGLVQPLLTHINRVLSNQEAGSSWSESTSWEQMEFSDFLGVLEDASRATYDLGVMEAGRPLSALMDILHELRQHCDAHRIPLPAEATRVSALDELMGMLAIIYFRKVVLETPESAASKLEQYQQLQEQMGWSDPQLAACTGPEARALLMYLNQVALAGEKRTNVTIRRSSAFWDAFECARRDGLIPGSAGPMAHKYFPLFVDETAQQDGASSRKPAVEAGEGHGPRKEFFGLAGQDMAGQRPQADGATSGTGAAAKPALWCFNRTAGTFWYNTTLSETPELRGAYAFAGWLLGQCLLNRAPLGVSLPAVLFRGLLEGHGAPSGHGGADSGGAGGFQPTLETLADFDPDAAAGIRNVASLPPDQLSAMLELEGLPQDWSAERYTQHAVAEVLRDGVAWQSAAVAAGFFAAVDRRLLRAWQLGPAALSVLVAGGAGSSEPPEDLSTLFRISLDEELVGASAPLVALLWQVLAAWSPERRLRFVEFVTGTSRLPLPGSELLKIQAPFVAMGAAEHKALLGMLPQAHTCDNLLELPNYWESLLTMRGIKGGPTAVARGTAGLTEAQLEDCKEEVRRILDDRLTLAVLNFSGYGLDERSRDDDDGEHDAADQDLLNDGADPEQPLTPAALTADSLASLARLSAGSSILPSSHPLTFDNANPSPSLHHRASNRRSASQRLGVGTSPLASPAHRGAPMPACSTLANASVVNAAATSVTPGLTPKASGELSRNTPHMTAEERATSLLMDRFDADPRVAEQARAAMGVPDTMKRQSSGHQTNDAFA
ncbi:hypothetical protein HYH03_014811 [Edaphochlamys debaryana]|uniref:HECT-type E3 ubiquitin transferase n=1 Tax=Edaphochlamys debaryana TaxID=47281 RepID=A0A835XN03_9CHLO|nr:hypothetical protein HYH03_014811 [Edaphochlamys debaryana]|eukprot:KAG2486509.1 hypothetical protein HYH03_014811 [Edaphochlamys debaryana]